MTKTVGQFFLNVLTTCLQKASQSDYMLPGGWRRMKNWVRYWGWSGLEDRGLWLKLDATSTEMEAQVWAQSSRGLRGAWDLLGQDYDRELESCACGPSSYVYLKSSHILRHLHWGAHNAGLRPRPLPWGMAGTASIIFKKLRLYRNQEDPFLLLALLQTSLGKENTNLMIYQK